MFYLFLIICIACRFVYAEEDIAIKPDELSILNLSKSESAVKISIYSDKNQHGKWESNVIIQNGQPDKNKYHVDFNHKVTAEGVVIEAVITEGNDTCPTQIRQKSNRGQPHADYIHYKTMGWYKYHGAAKWGDARRICDGEGGYLAVISSQQEADLFVKIFNNHPKTVGIPLPDFLLLGFHDMFVEGEYLTVLDTPLDNTGFTQWMKGQPDNAGNNEHCGAIHRSGQLSDVNCQQLANFICKIDE